MAVSDSPKAPDATFVRRRWVANRRVAWARECDAILLEHGAVTGSTIYPERHHARWRAQSLIKLMVRLDMHERWELREHTDKTEGGWIWTVEYLARRAGNG